jgi:tryptophanyl-tRNA synthetase
MSLSNPLKKMSKSMPEGCLEIFAPEKEIEEK